MGFKDLSILVLDVSTGGKFSYGLCPDGCMETGGRNHNWVGGMQVYFLQSSILYYIFLLCFVSYVSFKFFVGDHNCKVETLDDNFSNIFW